MFCQKCGRELGENEKFCGGCGSPVNAQAAQDNPEDIISETKTNEKNQRGRRKAPVIIALISAAAIIAAATLVRFDFGETDSVTAMLETAQKYLVELNYEQAIAEFNKVIEVDPINVDAYLGLAEAYERSGDTEKAIEVLEKGFELTGDERIAARLAEIRGENELVTTSAAETTTVTTTTEAQVTATVTTAEASTAALEEYDRSILDAAADKYLKDVDLENKTIKWLAHYDINPSSSGASESVALNLFKTKYGGEIQWYPTTWDTRYSDLSTYVLGGEGIDFFPNDTAALPKGVVSGMFQPVDDYIDLSDPLWVDMQSAMDVYYFSGKHYAIATSVSAENIIYYNTQTIEEQGFDDPWELYEAGEWNWDTFREMLLEFVDPDADQWGLDGYWYQKALYSSAGVPAVSVDDDGTLVTNLYDATLESAMNFGYDLYTNGLILDRALFDWAEQPQMLGEGRQLFYIVGWYSIQAASETWTTGLTPENIGVVPVPNPAGSDAAYQAATIDSWVLCKGADNPEGVALYADCQRLANTNDYSIATAYQKCIDDYQWTEELIAKNKEINALAQANPVVEIASGVSNDVAFLTTDGRDNVGLRAAFAGIDWATTRDSSAEVIATLVDEVDQQIKALS